MNPEDNGININIEKYTGEKPIEIIMRPGANEVAEDYKDKVIDENLKAIREIAPDIVIVEL